MHCFEAASLCVSVASEVFKGTYAVSRTCEKETGLPFESWAVPSLIWGMSFSNGMALGLGKAFDQRLWCVRGGMNVN
jgi:hypothetical protein